METKTKYRLLGATIVSALVVLLMVLVQGSLNDEPLKLAESPPPFPLHEDMVVPDDTIAASIASKTLQGAEPLANDKNRGQAPVIPIAAPHIHVESRTVAKAKVNEDTAPKRLSFKKDNDPVIASKNTAQKKPVDAFMAKDMSTMNAASQKAWAVQVGSFQSKQNALRLVNRLRVKGYPAFLQPYQAATGFAHRVLVGPKQEHLAARRLVEQLQTDCEVNGIIVSYKPYVL